MKDISHSFEVPGVSNPYRQRNRGQNGGCWGLRWVGVFKGDRGSVWEGEKVLGMDGGVGLITALRYSMPVNCPLKK